MNGTELAKNIIERFGTNDVFQIAGNCGASIIYQKWHPVTSGEFHRKTKEIYVNLNAAESYEEIIAHELGHFFLAENSDKKVENEEKIVAEFAKSLLENESSERF